MLTMGKTCKQIAPATLPVAWYIVSRSEPAEELMTAAGSRMTCGRDRQASAFVLSLITHSVIDRTHKEKDHQQDPGGGSADEDGENHGARHVDVRARDFLDHVR